MKGLGVAAVLAAGSAALMAAGLSGGLARLGLTASPGAAADYHGALMISGFFGTLIALERAVAHGARLALLVPALSMAGAIALLAGLPTAAAIAFIAAGLGLTGLTLAATLRQPSLHLAVMTGGAGLWAGGACAWAMGVGLGETAFAWLGFLLLTIVGERLELGRLRRPGTISEGVLCALVLVFIAGLVRGEPWHSGPLLPVALLGMGLWLVVHDIALVTIGTGGQPRFSAAALLAGYGWMMVAGLSLALLPPGDAVFGQDAAVHALAVGFVLTMVFAHAPIVLPAVAGLKVRYHAGLYLPLAVLQVSQFGRFAGAMLENVTLMQAAALGTTAALVLYLLLLLPTAMRGRARSRFGKA